MASEKNMARQMPEAAIQNEADGAEMEIDLVELMYRMIEKIKWIILAAVIGMVVGVLYTKLMITPEYEATSKLYVLQANNQVVDLTALNMSDKLTSDYVQVFKNWHVHEKVISTLNLDYTYKEIQDMLTITTPSDTRIIEIKVTSTDPQEAYDIAMAYANIAPAFIEAKMDTSRPNIFEEARVPTKPSAPSLVKNVFLTTFLGAVIAIAIIFIQFIADDRIRTADQLQKRLGLSTLGMMPVQEGNERSTKRNKGAKA